MEIEKERERERGGRREIEKRNVNTRRRRDGGMQKTMSEVKGI